MEPACPKCGGEMDEGRIPKNSNQRRSRNIRSIPSKVMQPTLILRLIYLHVIKILLLLKIQTLPRTSAPLPC